jgi:hypothetical protein
VSSVKDLTVRSRLAASSLSFSKIDDIVTSCWEPECCQVLAAPSRVTRYRTAPMRHAKKCEPHGLFLRPRSRPAASRRARGTVQSCELVGIGTQAFLRT